MQKKLSTKKAWKKISADISDAHDQHQVSLTKHAVYKTHDVDLGEDLVQVTFLKTLLYLRRGGKIHLMRAFLNHILNDLITDEYRKRKPTSLDALLEKGFEIGTDERVRLVNALDGKKIVSLIDQLPAKYQVIMRMRYLQDLSLKEMSLLTGQSTNTISVQTHRGLKKLRALHDIDMKRLSRFTAH